MYIFCTKLYSTGSILKCTGNVMYVQEKNCTVQNFSEEEKNMHSTGRNLECAEKILYVQKEFSTCRKISVLYIIFLKKRQICTVQEGIWNVQV